MSRSPPKINAESNISRALTLNANLSLMILASSFTFHTKNVETETHCVLYTCQISFTRHWSILANFPVSPSNYRFSPFYVVFSQRSDVDRFEIPLYDISIVIADSSSVSRSAKPFLIAGKSGVENGTSGTQSRFVVRHQLLDFLPRVVSQSNFDRSSLTFSISVG